MLHTKLKHSIVGLQWKNNASGRFWITLGTKMAAWLRNSKKITDCDDHIIQKRDPILINFAAHNLRKGDPTLINFGHASGETHAAPHTAFCMIHSQKTPRPFPFMGHVLPLVFQFNQFAGSYVTYKSRHTFFLIFFLFASVFLVSC